MQGSDGVHCLPRGRFVTPSGASAGFQREANTDLILRTARRAKILAPSPAALRRWTPRHGKQAQFEPESKYDLRRGLLEGAETFQR